MLDILNDLYDRINDRVFNNYDDYLYVIDCLDEAIENQKKIIEREHQIEAAKAYISIKELEK